MTKQEYENAEQKLRDSYVCDSDYYPRLVDLDSEYIASIEAENAALTLLHTQATDEMLKMQNRVHELEAENARLEKALNIAGRHIVEHEKMCPWNVVDGYVADECSECIANDNAIKSECWKAAFIKEAK